MRVEVLTAFGPYRVGDEIPDMPGGVARTYIGRSMVREKIAAVPAERIEETIVKRRGRPPGSGKRAE